MRRTSAAIDLSILKIGLPRDFDPLTPRPGGALRTVISCLLAIAATADEIYVALAKLCHIVGDAPRHEALHSESVVFDHVGDTFARLYGADIWPHGDFARQICGGLEHSFYLLKR